MSDAKRPPSIVPTPILDDGSGYRRRPKCALCGDQIRSATCSMVALMSDPEQLPRTAHPKCGREYSLYRMAMSR